jgi:hypothetical protein
MYLIKIGINITAAVGTTANIAAPIKIVNILLLLTVVTITIINKNNVKKYVVRICMKRLGVLLSIFIFAVYAATKIIPKRNARPKPKNSPFPICRGPKDIVEKTTTKTAVNQ